MNILTIYDGEKIDDDLCHAAEKGDDQDGFPAPFIGQRTPVEESEHGRQGAAKRVAHQNHGGLRLRRDLYSKFGRKRVVGARNQAIVGMDRHVRRRRFRSQSSRVNVLRHERKRPEIAEHEKNDGRSHVATVRHAGQHTAIARRRARIYILHCREDGV